MKKLSILAVSVVLIVAASASAQVPAAVILSFSPDSTLAGGSSFTLTVNGANFLPGAVVRLNGSTRSTTFTSSSRVSAIISFADLLTPTTYQVTVVNPGAAVSNALPFSVLPNAPTISSLDPNTLEVGTSLLAVRVLGQNFGTSAVARVNAVSRATSYISNKELRLNLSSTDVSHTGTLTITVLNPNNKLSNSAPITVVTPSTVPTITLLSPSSVAASSSAFTLSVVGTVFVSGSIVKVNGSSRATTFVDSTHLDASIGAIDVAKAGALSVTVTNPNGSVSNPALLTVTSGTQPVIQTISPTAVTTGSPGFTLTINGINFTTGATVKVGTATPRNAAFVSTGQLTVPILASDIIKVGQVPISVTTPAPNGGTSNQLSLFVTDKNAPAIASLSPSSLPTDSPNLKILLTGTNFLLDDIVLVNGSAHATEFISATQLAVTLLQSEIATPGVIKISVTRKDGTATSAPVDLTVTNAHAPAITGFDPPFAPAGTTAQLVVVAGRNFTSTSIVTFDNGARDTQFVSPTQLNVTLTPQDVAVPHDFAVVVIDGSGSSSVPVTYSVVAPVPTITSILPTSVISGEQDFELKVVGTNFSPQSVVRLNGSALATQLQTSTGALIATVPASAISASGTMNVTVSDSGVTSAPVPLNVLGPTITSVDPAGIQIGGTSVLLTVKGSAFLPTSKIVFRGSERITDFNADGSLSTTISGEDLTTPGNFAVVVRNSPNSSSLPFLITLTSPGSPQITSIDPASIAVGSAVSTIRVLGANFVPLSVVTINGTDRTTTFISGNEIRAALLPDDLARTAQLRVSVRNPDGTAASEAVLTVTAATFAPPRRRAVGH